MNRKPLHLLLVLSVAPSAALGAVREWTSLAPVGSWTEPTNWSPADAPDTAAETAVLDRFATYIVNLPGSTIPVGGLEVANGDLVFRSIGAGPAVVQVAGDAELSGAIDLQFVSAGTTFEIAGHLDLGAATELSIDGGGLHAASTDVAGGSLAGPTLVVLDNHSTADLGDLAIAPNLGAQDRAGFSLFDGSSLVVRNLQLGTGDPDILATLDLSDSTLTQAAAGVGTIGQPAAPGATGRGTLAVSEGGVLDLQQVTVYETGQIVSVASEVRVAQRLTVDGGVYDERGAATRVLGAGATLEAINQGELVFAGQTVTLAAGQTLRLANGGAARGAPIDLAGGRLRFTAGDARVDNPIELPAGGEVEVAASAVARFGSDFVNAGGELLVPIGASAQFEGDYRGEGAIGGGSIQFEGEVNPGMSPGVAVFGGDLVWTTDATHVTQLAGVQAGTYDQVVTSGAATLAGELRLELTGDPAFAPAAGDRFTLIESESLLGGFDTFTAPSLAGGLEWRLHPLATRLELWLVSPNGLASDFNRDGVVDAADYTLWRDAAGASGPALLADANGDQTVDAADLGLWRDAYGAIVPPPVTVPEPAASLLLTLLALGKLARPGQLP